MISFVGTAKAAGATLTLPAGIQRNDLILMFAYRNTTTAPTLGSGFIAGPTGSGNSNAYTVGYRFATGTDSAGIWTNASVVICVVYRGVANIGATAGSTYPAATAATIPGLTLVGTNSKSWVVALAGSTQTSPQGTPLAGATTVRNTQAGTTSDGGAFDTNGGVGSFSATTSSNNTSVTSCGISIELLGFQKTELVTDPFNQNTLDTTKWAQFTGGSATFTYSSGGGTVNFPAASTSSTDGELSNSFSDLTSSYAYLHVLNVASATTNADCALGLYKDGDSNNQLRWVVEAGTLYAQYALAGTFTTLYSVTYSSTTHAYWRIRESGGTCYWDTGVDNGDGTVTWTNRASAASPMIVAGVAIVIAGVCWKIEVNPGTFVFNNFNTIPGSGDIKTYNGTAWVAKPVKVWNGTSWVTKPLKMWNGTAWVKTKY